MNQNSTKLQNILGIYLLAGLIATGVLGWFVIRIEMNAGKQTANKVAEVNRQIASLNDLQKQTDAMRINYQKNHLKDKRDQILSLLPTENQEESLMPLLNDMAQGNGAIMSTFAPSDNSTVAATSPGGSSSSLSLYPAGINISGSYDSLRQFLVTLESGARFIDITSASLSGSSKGVQARLSLTAYYQKAQPDSPDASQTPSGGARP